MRTITIPKLRAQALHVARGKIKDFSEENQKIEQGNDMSMVSSRN